MFVVGINAMEPVRLVISDKSRLFREALKCALSNPAGMNVTIAASLEEAVATSGSFDVILAGVNAPGDVETLLDDRAGQKLESTNTRLVVLCESTQVIDMLPAVADRIDAILSRDITIEMLKQSLNLVLLGQEIFPRWLPSSKSNGVKRPALVSSRPAAHLVTEVIRLSPQNAPAVVETPGSTADDSASLSKREQDVLKQIVSGCSNKSIGRNLSIDEATVKAHVKRIFRKIGVENRTQAAIWAVNHNLGVEKAFYCTEEVGRLDVPPKVENRELLGMRLASG
jgi:two-component system nitrate/nitrite response regulator NarL